MMRVFLLVVAMLLIASFPFISNWLNVNKGDNVQKSDIEKIVDSYVVNNPKKIIESLEQYYRVQMEEAQKNQTIEFKNLFVEHKDEIVDFSYPSIKNNENAITVVEFFDYSCGYCKKAKQIVSKIMEKHNDINYVFRDFPMFGEPSMLVARYGVAVYLSKPDKYLDFYNKALDFDRNDYTDEKLLSLIQEIGIDEDEFSNYLKANDQKITDMLQKTVDLTKKIGINGAPAFIIGDKLVVGMLSEDEFEKQIQEVIEMNTVIADQK